MHPFTNLGLHLILIPRSGFLLPPDVHRSLAVAAERTAEQHRLRFSAVHTREDHMHVLIGASNEADIGDFISSMLGELRAELRGLGAHMSDFEWDEAVHVTLLPPWHMEIMASFVRDQDRYHSTRTLEEELDEVFRPNGIAQAGPEERQRRLGASAFHVN